MDSAMRCFVDSLIDLIRRLVRFAGLAGDEKGNLHRLLIVQTRVNVAFVRPRKVAGLQSTGATNALRDVITR